MPWRNAASILISAMTSPAPVVVETFEGVFQASPSVLAHAPGRVNLIGEHTDYNEGFVLPVAIDRSIVVAASPRDDRRLRIYSAQFDARDDWQVDAPRRTGRKEWRDYVRGVAWALLDAGCELRGTDLLITGDVPPGAGLSSSAALELAVAGALCRTSGINIDARNLAVLCQTAENQFVGVHCGIMDQFASALGGAGQALLIDCRSLDVEQVRLRFEDAGLVIVVVDSKVPRRLADTPYNQRREECAKAARLLGVSSLRDADESSITALPEPFRRRAKHVVTENQRVLDAVQALRTGSVLDFGHLMCESHASLRDDFDASCNELSVLVDLAGETPGVLGARLTGAGFGGCTVNLVRSNSIEEFERNVVVPYREKTGLAAEMFVCRATGGLEVIDV
jgi:galactokinase